MTPSKRAALLYEKAESQGLDAPTEPMIAEAIADAVTQREEEIYCTLKDGKFSDAAKWLENLLELQSLENMEDFKG